MCTPKNWNSYSFVLVIRSRKKYNRRREEYQFKSPAQMTMFFNVATNNLRDSEASYCFLRYRAGFSSYRGLRLTVFP